MLDTAQFACQLQRITPAATQGRCLGYEVATMPLRESSHATRQLAGKILGNPVATQLLGDRLYRAVVEQVAKEFRWHHPQER